MFSMKEIIDLAVQIERNGERVYRNAAKEHSNPSLTSILKWLADEEGQHADWFSRLKTSIQDSTVDRELDEMGAAMLRGVLGDQAFSLQEADFRQEERLEDLIGKAIEFEKDTVLFYEMMASFIDNQQSLQELKAIIEEENRHVRLLEQHLAELGSHRI